MNPVIAIPQMGNDLFRRYMKSKYVQSLQRAGADVRWIALEDTKRAVSEMLECSGLLLPGGADINPKLYGQEPSEKCGKPNELRDTAEWKMLEAFLPSGKPIFCICRGVQLLNVFFGGSLHQDIRDLQTCKHADFPSKNRGCHKVSFHPDTRLRDIFREESAVVNSLHHQAVNIPGPELTVSAVSEDGFTEGLELSSHPFCIGVQWHPEHMSKKNERQQNLFNAFARACKGE